MYRLDNKNTKIAYAILGTPPNLAYKPNKHQQEINKKLIADETTRAR